MITNFISATTLENADLSPASLAAMTEPEIDTINASLAQEIATAEAETDRLWRRVFVLAGYQKETYRRGRGHAQRWPVTRDEARRQAETILEGADLPQTLLRGNPVLNAPLSRARHDEKLRKSLEDIDKVNERVTKLEDTIGKALQDEWVRRGGWSRFFLCTANDGHIHSTTSPKECGTLRLTTQFAWLPQLSGLTEEDAVKAHGAILCSVCFKTAPIEWTVGRSKKKSGECEYSRTQAKTGTYNPRRQYNRVTCECGERVTLTPTFKLRAHKKP